MASRVKSGGRVRLSRRIWRKGCGRNGDAEFGRFCSIAAGSASELEYHLLLARDLALIDPRNYENLAEQTVEVKRMLSALLQKLKADS
jgi:four helix bundle protein